MAWGVRCRIEAGQAVVTGPSRAARTGSALRASGTMARTRAGPEQGGDGDGHRLLGDVVVGGEVPLVDLLAAAGGVELDHLDVQGVGEVGHRGIVEGQVPVLPDAQAAQVEGVGAAAARRSVGTRPREGPARRCSGRPGVRSARRCARGSSAGSWPDGRARSRRTRPCGRPRRRPRARRRCGATRASTKASWELPVANMAWATPRSATAARSTAAASSAAARAMAAVVAKTRTPRAGPGAASGVPLVAHGAL